MDFIPLSLPGLVLIRNKTETDERGFFIKIYNRDIFAAQNIDFVPREEFYTSSSLGVLRGMHFQLPPAAYGKLVHCIRGKVHDVALDLRKGSPTYGHAWSGQLDDVRREAVYLPPGFAHGFYSLASDSLMAYSVSSVHQPKLDQGISWDSFGHDWPSKDPILSERDCGHVSFEKFITPFSYP